MLGIVLRPIVVGMFPTPRRATVEGDIHETGPQSANKTVPASVQESAGVSVTGQGTQLVQEPSQLMPDEPRMVRHALRDGHDAVSVPVPLDHSPLPGSGSRSRQPG